MATADTINSIRTHLTADYESLENIGAELENVDKNIENIASVVNGIYDNLPKTTGEDTNLSLNTIKGKMNIIPKGDTQQTQYEGYNVLPTTVSQSTHNGITIQKQSDGSYKVTGTATGNAILYILNESDNITLPSGNYYISGCPTRWCK